MKITIRGESASFDPKWAAGLTEDEFLKEFKGEDYAHIFPGAKRTENLREAYSQLKKSEKDRLAKIEAEYDEQEKRQAEKAATTTMGIPQQSITQNDPPPPPIPVSIEQNRVIEPIPPEKTVSKKPSTK